MNVSYSTPEAENIRFEIIDQTGRVVFRTEFLGGQHVVPLQAEHLNSGVYFYRANTALRNLVNGRVVIIR